MPKSSKPAAQHGIDAALDLQSEDRRRPTASYNPSAHPERYKNGAAVLPCCLTFARTAAPAPSTATVDTAQPAAQIESDSSPLPGSFDANLPKFCHAAVSLSLRSIFTQQRCFPFPPGFGLSASVCQAHRTERQHLQNNSKEIILVYERKHIWPLCSKQFASCVHDLSY